MTKSEPEGTNPWLLWTLFFSALLIFASLWMIPDTRWHLVVSGITLIILWQGSPTPLKTLAYIIGLVGFLVLLQILFSSFMRSLFLRSLNQGFHWSDWQYLLFAVARFAWPLAIVATFQKKLTQPTIIAHLTQLLAPLKYLGLKIDKLQVMILLALKFMPSLQTEWHRFAHFQTYFVARLPKRTLIQKLSYWQGVLKALISHTIHRSVSIGDLL
ncbi:MAG: energy-coupling factor transporter transmembrane protein EcfT, partial [Candidatus Marinimicrobia bacterium]|nr:energy-coupling factor transporter transmembrane protein EcfT [Candidatus Neomarinimicrobiota bacterium]